MHGDTARAVLDRYVLRTPPAPPAIPARALATVPFDLPPRTTVPYP